MSYIVLARKYRPSNFDEVVGQEHITSLLQKAITGNRLSHAYLFCGPRGIGKTSCARILAKSLNCKEGPTLQPCNKCPACDEINKGSSFDVLEIDGASNRGIDEIRTLRENVKFAPSYGRYKIYIVDEVHMLTTEAFNALLKTLEEPPEHVKFIFATTDPNKVPATIISRCQRFDFKRIPFKTIVDVLAKIGKAEKFQIEQDALYAIAKAGQGSLRDALSILDQVGAISDRSIQGEDVYSMLGVVETESLFELADALSRKDAVDALRLFNDIIDKGKDVRQFSKDLIEHFRNLMIIKIGGKTLGKLVDYPVEIKEMYLKQSGQFSLPEILSAIDLFIAAQDMARTTETLRTPLEIAFARMTYSENAPAAAASVPPSLKPAASQTPHKNLHKFSAVGILKDKKGMVSISDHREDPNKNVVLDEIGKGDPKIKVTDLTGIKKSWDALTFAISREKMSVATFLQEGYPNSFDGEKLVVGFTAEHEFHKNVLQTKENIALVERIIAQTMGQKIYVRYEMIGQQNLKTSADEEQIVQKALATFQGKIVNKWHKE